MKYGLSLLLVSAVLTGCHKAELAGGDGRHGGRYLGVGTYPAGELWQRLARKDAPANPQAATLADDDQIIVTVDSRTGEIRQCGNLSGHCVSSSPWKVQAAPAPAALSKHAAELAKEREARPRDAI
jgi:hypothetical protein